ncbi:GGDEF domain-containing protein [Pseudoalteromonas sp. 1CM17D]|uniref:bifunctional diguanylate cyclase/phosphodiesterase n=1 Tax=Pseudoalteromonas sp. 1CM17D TaxID=2929162 RepID=UPI0020BE83B7|nr:GGDEF domain-containing protein [Pseudoalteromonas sp. 1CM17D]MCK8095175.1 GGDEF domain-containing protein [Pseudoalteromonas sp. 1CM17D]
MLTGKLKGKWFIAGFTLFLVSLLVYVYYTYSSARSEIMHAVDERLLNAATSVKHILGQSYHDRISQGYDIGFSVYQTKSKQLSELAQALDIAYVYSMIMRDNKVYFTSSSYTKDDQENARVTQFLDLYPEATDINRGAFYSTEPVFEQSSDQWGDFKTVFIPFVDKYGTTYITGADITLDDLNKKLQYSVTKAIITACFFFFIAVLVAAIYIYLLKRTLTTDASTGFANHIALKYFIKKSNSHHMQLAIIWVNEIEDINSFYGTQVGDSVMKNLLSHYQIRSPQSCKVYRLATNKIVVLTPKSFKSSELSDLVESYNANSPVLTNPFIYITYCAGIANGNKSQLIENAHIATLQAKHGRGKVVSYSKVMSDVKNQYQYNVSLAKEVQEAFDNNRIVPYFQAMFNTTNNEVVHYECLARMVTKNGEILKPDSFLNVVSRSRMGGLLTRTLFSQCIERFRKTDIYWSLNISDKDILDPSLSEYIANELKRYPHPENITLGLLESHAITNFLEVKTFISMVKTKGVNVIITGFGSGYSNISNALKLEVNGIKFDGALVKQAVSDENIALFIEHTVHAAKQLGLTLMAESVENISIENALKNVDVALMQGNYFAYPAPHVNSSSQEEVAV